MQPMKPEQIRSALMNRPEAQPSDLEEYQRLLSQRFTTDPDREQPAAAPLIEKGRVDREERLRELYRTLFQPQENTEESQH
jgi:hypothetical protein